MGDYGTLSYTYPYVYLLVPSSYFKEQNWDTTLYLCHILFNSKLSCIYISIFIFTRRNLSAPFTTSGDFDRCMTFDTNWTEVLQTLQPPPPNASLIPCQHGWEFELSDIPYHTISTEVSFNVYCSFSFAV